MLERGDRRPGGRNIGDVEGDGVGDAAGRRNLGGERGGAVDRAMRVNDDAEAGGRKRAADRSARSTP